MLGQHQLVLSKCLPLLPVTALQIRLYPTLHSIITFRAGWEGNSSHYICSYFTFMDLFCVFGGVGTLARARVWRSEDYLQESGLSFHYLGPRD